MQWSQSESNRAFVMHKNGEDLAVIADVLGRSAMSVKAHLIRASMDPAKRKAQDLRAHAHRALVRRLDREANKPFPNNHIVMPERHTTAEAMRARAERDLAFDRGHRDYTAEFCGDPLIGRSALDARHRG